jgi:hypothetical protein
VGTPWSHSEFWNKIEYVFQAISASDSDSESRYDSNSEPYVDGSSVNHTSQPTTLFEADPSVSALGNLSLVVAKIATDKQPRCLATMTSDDAVST